MEKLRKVWLVIETIPMIRMQIKYVLSLRENCMDVRNENMGVLKGEDGFVLL